MKTAVRALPAAIALALGGAAGGAAAAGFALIEQNSSGLGNAYAGQAAAAEDASTIFFNPAGMAYLPGGQAVMAGHAIAPSAKFSADPTRTTAPVQATGAPSGFPVGSNGGDAGDTALIPSLYFSWSLDPKWNIGIGVNAPFGLRTEYDPGWAGEFHALKSEVKSLNVNPGVSYKVNDAIAVGFGLNWQRVEAEFTKTVNYSFVGQLAAGQALLAGNAALAGALNTEALKFIKGSNQISGSDSGWGFNLGAMINVGADTRVGLAYRSAVNLTLSGTAAYFGAPPTLSAVAAANAAVANQIATGSVTANLKTPASFSAAVKHRLNSNWDLLADVSWTQWSSFKSLDIVRTSGLASGAVLESTPENWRDTWRVGIGANYRYTEAWTFRLGAAYDQSPVPSEYLTPRVPDGDRTWLAFGAQYKVSKDGAIDFGYAHLFMDSPSQNFAPGTPALSALQLQGRGNLVGTYDDKVDILSVQYRHSF